MEFVYEVAGRAFTWESAAFAFVLALIFGALAWRFAIVVVTALLSVVMLQLGEVWIQAFAGAPAADLWAATLDCLTRGDWQVALFQFAALLFVTAVVYLQKRDWQRLERL